MPASFSIDGRKIGPDQPPYVIAELSGNHNGSLEGALKLIEEAKKTGADAVKLQTYTADSLTINSDREEFLLKDGTWKGWNLYKLYEQAHTPWDWFPVLFKKARELGITVFSSPFDKAAVDFLDDLGVPAFKIASNELSDWPLVQHIASKKKPIILSVGTSTREQVVKTVEFLKSCGAKDMAVLHCVSEYPAPPERANMLTIDDIAQNFGDIVPGFSDHTLGTAAAIVSVARGSCVIEKHFTIDRNDGGVDSTFSAEPAEMKKLCEEVVWAWKSLGKVQYGGETDLEKKGIFTRQFWTIEDIKGGDVLTEKNIKSIRGPANSGAISTIEFQNVYGLRATKNIAKHEPLLWDHVDSKEGLNGKIQSHNIRNG